MKRPKLLLVMHKVPLESGFLAAKFVGLSRELDTYLFVWDSFNRIRKFIHQNPGIIQKKIYSGIYNFPGLILSVPLIIFTFLISSAFRKLILKGDVKFALQYLPLFKVKPDIIHFEFGTLASEIRKIKEITGAKTTVSFRGYDLNYVGLDHKDYYKDVWAYADGYHFLGNDLKERAIKRGYNTGKKEVLIPPAIDISVFTPGEKKIPGDELSVLSTGRLTWKKGFEYALQAFAKLKTRNIPFKYTIIGDGPHLQALQFTIFELGLQDDVTLAGRRSPAEVKQMLSGADVFLHPAISEGFCNAVLEAQAMAVPVICTDADGLKENIIDGETGFAVPKWDVVGMADKLEWCFANKEKLSAMGYKGVERVRERFVLEDQIAAFVSFYQKVYEQ